MKNRTNKALPSHRPSPYRVPEGFFDELESKVWATIAEYGEAAGNIMEPFVPERRSRMPRSIIRGFVAAVAMGIIATGAIWLLDPPQLTPEQAFNALSDADQEYILESYSYMMDTDDNQY